MPLHPQCKAFLDMLAAAGGPPLYEIPLADARAVPKRMIELGGPEEPVARVEDRTIEGPAEPIRVRVYRPSTDDKLPALLFFHGGGFVICDLDSHDRQCRSLANQSGCVVISVDYRLAPEHPFPAAPEDCYAATRYVAEHAAEFGVDRNRIAVGGDSAGGNLATVVAMMARDRGGPTLRFQLLIYPVTDFEDRSPSLREFDGNFLNAPTMKWFEVSYLPDAAERRQPYASPLRAPNLSGLPPAMVITAECDPVRDQGEAYARRLQDAGVPVQFKRYEGMIHPFFNLAGIVDGGRTLITESASAVRAALSGATVS